jgi:hypothetical protein
MCRNASTGKLVMLKQRRDADTSMFETELSALGRLRGCPGIVQLLDVAYSYSHLAKGGKELPAKAPKVVLVLEYVKGTITYLKDDIDSAACLRNYFSQLMQVAPLTRESGVVMFRLMPSWVGPLCVPPARRHPS